MSVDWKSLAPKRVDWERLTAAFEAAGLPRPCWMNGVPVFGRDLTAKEEGQVQAVAMGTTPHKTKKALIDEPGPVHPKKAPGRFKKK